MITESTLRENNRHVDDSPVNNLQKEIPFRNLCISNTASNNDQFSPPDLDQNVNNNPTKILEQSQFAAIIPSLSILMELPMKIMNGVSDLLNLRSNSPDSEIPAKRPYSPRSHHHSAKQTPIDIARGRGRGRGRSQLRRSGVSQAQHRQERIRQRLLSEIQDDLKGLREFEDMENLEDDVPSMPSVDENGRRIRYSAEGAEPETTGSSKFPLFFGYSNMKQRNRKQQNKNENGEKMSISNNCNVRYIPECPIDIVTCNGSDDEIEDNESDTRMSRKRLQSDRSVDSEDSYCIVFENSSESDFATDYDYTTTDDEDEDENEDEDEDEDEVEDADEDEGSCGEHRTDLKVRFSPHPKIHTMITWDYAYRAARKGPWEEMARDRERFKIRINSIARVLDPILVPQHRSEIWQHRFAVNI